MSIRLASTQLLAPGILLSQYAGHGVRGDAIPSTGTHGPAPLYAWLTLPADAANEYRWAVTTPPAVGDLVIFEDGSYSYTPPPATVDLLESFDFDAWENGSLLGSATYTITIGSTGVTLSVADAAHGHSADNITLAASGSTSLTVADAAHGHTVDGLTLTAASVLAIQEALHAHAADAITLDAASGPVLLLADGLHAHTADGLTLTVQAWLVVAEARHVHRADNVALTFVGPIVLSAPPSGHGSAMTRRTTSAGRSRPAQLNSRTR